jgi:hypothetical protein
MYLFGHTVAISLQCAVTLRMRQFTGPLALHMICIQRYIYVTDRSEVGWHVTELHVMTIECEAPHQDKRQPIPQFAWYPYSWKTLRKVKTDKDKIFFFFHGVCDQNLYYVPELTFREYYLCVPYKHI